MYLSTVCVYILKENGVKYTTKRLRVERVSLFTRIISANIAEPQFRVKWNQISKWLKGSSGLHKMTYTNK